MTCPCCQPYHSITMPTALLNGLNFYYRVDGDGPRTFLFFNGAGLTTESWQDIATSLAKTGRLVRFDARGCGQTETPSVPFTMEDMAEDALSLIDRLDIPQVIVVGHAFGGRIAQIFTHDYPERVRALVLCGTGGKYPPLTRDLDAKAADPNIDDAARIELFFARWFGPQFRRKHPERAEGVLREMYGGTGQQAPALAPRRPPQITSAESYWAKVPASIPVLLIYGHNCR